MALNDVTISLDLNQLLGGDIDTRRTRVYVKTNVTNNTLIDTSTGETRFGDERVTLEADGTGTFTTWGVGADGNPTSWQTYVVVEYPRAGSRDRVTRTFGPYTITDVDDGKTLAELEDQQAIPPNYQTAFTADMEAIRDETQAIRDGIVGDLGTTDSQTATLINSPGSLTETALTASYGRTLGVYASNYDLDPAGVADMSANIQAAIDDTPTGGTLWLPPHDIRVNGLTRSSAISIVCLGANGYSTGIGARLRAFAADDAPLLLCDSNSPAALPNGLLIQGVNFDGGGLELDALLAIRSWAWVKVLHSAFVRVIGRGTYFQNVQEARLYENTFRRCGGKDSGNAIYLDDVAGGVAPQNVNNFAVRGSTFGGCGGDIIGTGDNPNLDAIWIDHNKFEYDETWGTFSEQHSVIDLAAPSRTLITHNTFGDYKPSNGNNISTLITLRGNNTVGPAIVKENVGYLNEGTFLAISGQATAIVDDNVNAADTNMTITNTSSRPSVYGERALLNRRNTQAVATPIATPPAGFVGVTRLMTEATKTYVTDADSISFEKQVIEQSTAFVSLFVYQLGGYVGTDYTNVLVRVRVKATGASDSVINATIGATTLPNQTVTAGAGWQWKTFTVPVATIAAAADKRLKVNTQNAQTTRVDGIIPSAA